MQITTLRTFKTENVILTIEVVETHDGSQWLADLYTGTDTHEAGTTIQVPDHLQSRHGFKYYIGQYRPADLARDFAAQGRENPSATAYESLQKELGHYITADDCYLQATVSVAGHELASIPGISFDYSYEYADATLEDTAAEMLRMYGRDFIREAIAGAREELALIKQVA